MAQPSTGLLVGEQAFRKRSVQVEKRVAIEADLVTEFGEDRDCVLVIEDHLSLGQRLSVSTFAHLEKPLRFENRVGVSFKPTGVPRKINDQAIHYLAQESPGSG